MATRADVLQAVSAAREAHRRMPDVVRLLMRYYDITDGLLAESLGVSRQTVNGWINRRTKIPREMEEGLATFFDVPPAVLLMEDGDALRWVLDHPSDLLKRIKRCLAA